MGDGVEDARRAARVGYRLRAVGIAVLLLVVPLFVADRVMHVWGVSEPHPTASVTTVTTPPGGGEITVVEPPREVPPVSGPPIGGNLPPIVQPPSDSTVPATVTAAPPELAAPSGQAQAPPVETGAPINVAGSDPAGSGSSGNSASDIIRAVAYLVGAIGGTTAAIIGQVIVMRSLRRESGS